MSKRCAAGSDACVGADTGAVESRGDVAVDMASDALQGRLYGV